MGMYYKLYSTCTVKKEVAKALPEFKEKVREMFKDYKCDMGHSSSVTVIDDDGPLKVELSFSDHISYTGAEELDAVWEAFCKEYADFDAGPVSCKSVNDDAASEDDRVTEWYIGTGQSIVKQRIDELTSQMQALVEEMGKLKKSKLAKNAKVVSTRESVDGEEI